MSNIVALATGYLILIGWFALSLPVAILLGKALAINDRLGAGQQRQRMPRASR